MCRIDSNVFSNFVLLGDFNIDFNNAHHPFYNQLTSFMSSLFFTQVVSSPTQVTPQSSTLIDLALVSELSLVYSCDILPPLANSDHYGVILQLRTRKVRYSRNATCRKVEEELRAGIVVLVVLICLKVFQNCLLLWLVVCTPK